MPEPADAERQRSSEPQCPEGQPTSAARVELETLQHRLAAAEADRDGFLDLLQRARANVENEKKRIQRTLAEERRFANASFASELLPVLDNLQRALDADIRDADTDPLILGVNLVKSQMLEVLRRFGVNPIAAQGKPFDPMFHEAVTQEPRSDVPSGTVVRVLEPGYVLYERLLRPAKVVIATSEVS